MPSFLLNIKVIFLSTLLIETCFISCIIDIPVGTYAILESLSSLACEETDWSVMVSSVFVPRCGADISPTQGVEG